VNVDQNAQIAAALGQKLWTCDLFMPTYRPGRIGPWKIITGSGLSHHWGYFTGPCMAERMPLLARREDGTENTADGEGGVWNTWMSLSPLEIESQEIGCRHAQGHTAVMGLGMGWVAANMALHPNVTKVTVVEVDTDVIDLFHHSGALDSIPHEARDKLDIVNADATEWQPDTVGEVDLLHADIWLRLAEPQALEQVRQMQSNVQAKRIYYWGQEIAIYKAARTFLDDDAPLTPQAVRQAIDEVIGLPLLAPPDADYAQLITQAIQNRVQRQLQV
jgi:hypothetical protein